MNLRAPFLAIVILASFGGAQPAASAAPPPRRPTAPAPQSAQAAGFDFSRPQVVATGLEIPWGLAFLPDGSALVSERMNARILQLRPGSQPEEAARISGVVPSGEGGLLGIAVSPNYSQDNFVYAHYTASSDNRIVRFRLGGTPTQQPILTGMPKANIHDGGRIHFGPDGMLYAGTGDANNTGNAQNQQSLGGKILRMRPDGGVPTGNPFPNSVVFTLGHRNVQGLGWDAQGLMFAAEFGQNRFDEINHIVAGGNYGWPEVEGTGGAPRFRDPIVTWTVAEASPSGIAVAGDTLYAAALRGQRLWLVPLDGRGGTSGPPSAELQGTFGRLRTVTVGPDGWLWVMTSNRDGRGNPVPADDRVIRFPPMSGGGTEVFADDFETDKGWTGNATDTATTGRWERGDPEPTNSGGALQLGTTTSGANALVTGRLAGASVGANDIDGGVTTIRSPEVQLPASSPTLSFSWYLAHLSNASAADFFRIRVLTADGAGQTVFEKRGSATRVNATWQTVTANLAAFAGQRIRLQVEAADADSGSLVEAGVDDVRITAQ